LGKLPTFSVQRFEYLKWRKLFENQEKIPSSSTATRKGSYLAPMMEHLISFLIPKSAVMRMRYVKGEMSSILLLKQNTDILKKEVT